MKLKIGITGQRGFIGQHLYNTLGLYPDEFERIDFNRPDFEDKVAMSDFVNQCDVVVHLAAMNRDPDPERIYQTNLKLVTSLIEALETSSKKPHVIFSSSSQEERDNLYGRSKKEGRNLFSDWANRGGGSFAGLVIPNVFGPFGLPYYNSFIATFCYQLTHDELPSIETDGKVQLIYVGDLVAAILKEIRERRSNSEIKIHYTDEYKVSEILTVLERFRKEYFVDGAVPDLRNRFELNLFNTFRSYIEITEYFPKKYVKHTDPRGVFVEVIRLNNGGQISFSTTVAGITRGNHYHTRKIERFSVIKGKALIQLRKIRTQEVFDFYLDGDEPAYVDMPVWYTHNISNIGEDDLYTNFWINEFYDPADPDTFMEVV